MAAKRPLKLREILERLRSYGIVVIPGRGKGSELILVKPDQPGSKRGPQFPLKNHGMGTEISKPVINAILRRFGIPEKAFWE